MQEDPHKLSISRNWLALALLFFLILPIYSNTFKASWHFDDYFNIIDNPRLQIKDFKLKTILGTFTASYDYGLYRSKKIYRPVPCLSFAINWYFNKKKTFGYHVVNITIHFLTASFLFLALMSLFNSPKLKGKYTGSEYFIALLAAAFWAVNPIQTQAVTYIVQRMACMAAMFYILGIYCYVEGRNSVSRSRSIRFYLGCLICFLLSLGSKENGAALPLALLLIEFVFYRNLALQRQRRIFFWTGCGIGLFIIIGGMLFFKGGLFSFLDGYEVRSFTLLERLMTETRVVLFYLSQIFYPISYRLSVAHQVDISTSLFVPWTTLPAIITIFLLICIGFSQVGKRPIIAFAILFFFMNHMMESTIFPLELIFEHRNYLPSLFLFFPVAAGLKWGLDYYHKKKRAMYVILVSFITLLLIGLGSGTYIRNMAWATEKSLWEDAMIKAPGTARPLNNLSCFHYWIIGEYDTAMYLYQKAMEAYNADDDSLRALVYCNMSDILVEKFDYVGAINLLKRSLSYKPAYERARYHLVLTLCRIGQWDEAMRRLDFYLSEGAPPKFLDLKGFIFLQQKKYEYAILCFKKVLELSPDFGPSMLNIGVSLTLTGKYSQGVYFLRRAKKAYRNNIVVPFALIENRVRAGDRLNTEKYVEDMFNAFSINRIKKNLKKIPDDILYVPVSREVILPVIAEKLEAKSKEMLEMGVKKKDQSQGL